VLVTGVRMLPWTAVTMFVTPLAGRMADRIGNRALMVTGLLLQGVAFAWLAAVVTPSADYASLVLPLLMAGTGVALVFPAMANAAVGGVAAEELGMASATNTSFRSVGATFGVAIAGALFERAGGFGGAAAISAGVVPGLAVAAAISVLGATLAIGVHGRPRRLAVTLTPAHALDNT
jgi:MFS family permease